MNNSRIASEEFMSSHDGSLGAAVMDSKCWGEIGAPRQFHPNIHLLPRKIPLTRYDDVQT
jgi:hypothetical protein